jgi:hypothetical protein
LHQCPVCKKEHGSFLELAGHMVFIVQNEKHDEHQLWLSFFTNEPFVGNVSGKDSHIAMLMQKYYGKHRHLPSMKELL